MRMRKLAAGQSVVFCVPEEIETKVREIRGRTASSSAMSSAMSVSDILLWAVQCTWTDLGRSMAQWVTQGTTFSRHKAIWDRAKADCGLPTHSAEGFQDIDALSLEARYRPQASFPQHEDESHGSSDREILGLITERRSQFEGFNVLSGSLQEEQERELAPEIEQERQLERPAPAEAETHWVHPDVDFFVRTGVIQRSARDEAFIPAFHVFKQTSAAADFNIDSMPTELLVTRDFSRTIQRKNGISDLMDDYQRTVHWVLTDRQPGERVSRMVILSPFEANVLMATIETSTSVVLHLFAPRQNETYRPLDDLRLYSIPEVPHLSIPHRLRTELLLFSGQLYFGSFDQYARTCEFLCLAHMAMSETSTVGPDGFISPQSHSADRDQSTIFHKSPVRFLKGILTKMRRHGESIDKTHLGKVLEGAQLAEEDFYYNK